MGESRFNKLEAMLPEDVSVFGLDEHTACLIDLENEEAVIKGLGGVTLRRRGEEVVFQKGERFSLEVLRGGDVGKGIREKISEPEAATLALGSKKESFWDKIHGIKETFHIGLEKHDPKETTNALLELDRAIWQGKQDLENEEFISQAREVLRDLIVLFGMKLETSPKDRADCLAPVIAELLSLRQRFRANKQWKEADAIRESLELADVIIEDTEEGPRWRLRS
jgi:hypothetical protein